MKKNKLILILSFAFLIPFSSKIHAQIFQNSNAACEVTPVLCTSSSASTAAYTCNNSYADNLACKNKFAEADMNNDGYTDCVFLDYKDNLTDSIPTFSVLLNSGNGAATCGGTPGIFGSTTDYVVIPTNLNTHEKNNGSIAVGRINTSDTGDSVWLHRISSEGGSYLGFIPTGFDLTTDEPTSSLIEFAFDWDVNYRGSGRPSMVLSNCADSSTETDIYFPLVKTDSVGNLQIQVLRTGVYTNINTGISVSVFATPSIALGDFNEDGQNDVVLAVDDALSNGGAGSQLLVCLSSGNCSTGSLGFNCTSIQIMGVGSSHVSDDLQLLSITSGDFNGDGHQDIAMTETGFVDKTSRGVHIFQGNGDGTFSQPGVHVDGNLHSTSGGVPFVLATGCFNNDNYEDIVYSYDDTSAGGAVGLLLSEVDGSGNFTNTTPPTELSLGSFFASNVSGIDTADFDREGGSDIMVLASNGSARGAYLFMNSVETVSASAGASTSINVGDTVNISDDSCNLTPADAAVSYRINWATNSTPLGASALTYSNATSAHPTVTNFTSAGTYILKLNCVASRCGTTTSNFRDTAYKTINVSAVAFCGNNIIETGEECDNGTASNGLPGNNCTADCKSKKCGDGTLQRDLNETCDDGNRTNGDGCDEHCQLECNHNNIREGFEQCDDGNAVNGDGCDSNCRIECGNGVVGLGETCDDGNTTSGDGCDSSCKIEQCGDHIVDAHETCDDGNTVSGDGCSSTCQSEGTIQCGNGVLETGEGCDHGALNGTTNDSCSADCKVISANPICGNRVIETGEACDDGNTRDGDGCSSSCASENVSNPPPSLGVGLDSQGGCIASLNPQTPFSPISLVLLFGATVLLLVIRFVISNGALRSERSRGYN